MRRSIGRAVLITVSVLVFGQGLSPGVPARPQEAGATVRPSLRHDLSAPVSAIPVPNRRPPLGGGDPDAGSTRAPTPSSRAHLDDPLVGRSVSAGQAPAVSESFDGIDNVDGYTPPDPNGDVGPNDYVQVVNDSFAVYDKQGHRRLGPEPVSMLWRGFGGMCEGSGRGDPVVLYDPLADRFLLSQFAFRIGSSFSPVGPYYECIAVTRTGDPTGAWYRYAFLISETKLDDYPKLGVWPDGYYMTVNQFQPDGNWGGVGVVAFDRTAMLEGDPASIVYLDSPDPLSNGMLPADLDGWRTPPAGSPEYLMGFDTHRWGHGLALYRFRVDWTNPASSSFEGPLAVPTAPFDSVLCGYDRDCIAQPGTADGLDPMSYRLMYRLAYRNFGDHESMVVNHTVAANGADQAGVRWYEVRDPAGSPSVYQQGTYAADADSRFNGSIAMDQSGDIGLGYTVSSSSTYPSVRYTGRLASDPPGQMAQGEGSIQGGTGSQIGALHRWGDYSSMSVDPSDDCTFWYTNEYYETTNGSMWSTRVGSFRFPGCGPSGPALSIGDIVTREGEDAVFTVQLSPASDETVSVDYATEPGTAGSEDFQAASGTLTFAPGETSQEFSVPVALDADREPNETFSALLSNPVNAEVRAVRGTATIQGEATSAPGTGRPDGAIKTAGSGFRGARVYNATGWHQTQRAKLRAGRTRRFVIRIHNSGTARQRYVVRGPGSSPTFGVEYRTGGTHRLVTKQVVKGRYAVWVPAGRDRVLRLVVSAGRRAHRGWRRGFLVVTAPAGAGAHRDAVKAVVTVRKRH